MLFPKKERYFYQLQAPLTSLIDIVFLLLIYFLLTTNFIVDEGIKIKLPNASTTSAQTEKEITIVVDKKGSTFIENREVPLNQLFGVLKERLQGREDGLVVIRADRGVVLNKAVRVMDVAKAAGAGRLALATEKK
ncbi:MAG: biopolymer transporter ExbD [Deltaproteobacteria bacterium]|nr:biopolymer transporter ExbD [Deltaproteobacteria bacterium]MBW2296720.1 biopolymer transporter ExbD [Deltaproteobacteria bacterium]MBW2611777.1 biopolymer transporter ExbD [Deltaproteobacteria bacterium]MBW2677041.1 biopolymer transporter ExbD [Deltaproteobacteria bacterium]